MRHDVEYCIAEAHLGQSGAAVVDDALCSGKAVQAGEGGSRAGAEKSSQASVRVGRVVCRKGDGSVKGEIEELDAKLAESSSTAASILDQYIGERDEAQSALAPLLLEDAMEYEAAYEKIPIKTRAKIGNVLLAIAADSSRAIAQPLLCPDTTSLAYLDALIAHSRAAVEEHLKPLVSSLDGTAITNIKNLPRLIQKTKEKYAGDYSRILDAGRGMVVFKTAKDMLSFLKKLQTKKKIVRAKDRFSPSWDASLSSGYRDVLLNLSFKPGGAIVELQLHLEDLLAIKNATGHENYEMARTLHVMHPCLRLSGAFGRVTSAGTHAASWSLASSRSWCWTTRRRSRGRGTARTSSSS